MANVQAQERRFRSRACWVLGSMLAACILCLPEDNSGSWAAPAGQGSAPCHWDETVKDELRVPIQFDRVFGAILLCIEVYGKPAQVILDTGSNVTILRPDLDPRIQTDPSSSMTPQKGSGYVSTGHWGEANLHLGDRYWINRRILVDEMQSISQAHKQRIDGILGRDILKEFRFVIIDYEKKVLTFGTK